MKTVICLLLISALTINALGLSHKQTSNENVDTKSTSQNNSSLSPFSPSNYSSILPTGWNVATAQSHYQNISNLNSKSNWIVGDQSIDNYTTDLYNFITTNNISKCPKDTPYAKLGDNNCVDCNGDKPVFDLKRGQCVACPDGYTLNTNTHTCDKAPTLIKNDQCTANYVWNKDQNKCLCPTDYPIDLGCECVACLQPFVWDTTQKTCKLRCPFTYQWNSQKSACECPSSTYEVKGQCITCDLPFQWNSASNSCNLKLDSQCTTQAAGPSTAVTTPSTTNTTTTTTTTPTTTTTTTSTSTSTTPNLNTTSSSTATSSSNTAPSSNSTSSSNGNISYQSCSSNYVFDQVVQKCVCPKALPFNDSTKCVDCKLPKYWDHTTLQCIYCPDKQYFNVVSKNCQNCPSDKPYLVNYVCQATQ